MPPGPLKTSPTDSPSPLPTPADAFRSLSDWLSTLDLDLAPYLIGAAVTLVLCLTVGPLRRAIRRALHSARVNYRWRRAVMAVAPQHFNTRAPKLWRAHRVPVGERGEVWVPHGATVADLEARREAIAGVLGVREVRVRRNPANARRAWVTVVERDPLAGSDPLLWPNAEAERLSLWRSIPVGVDEDGREVTMHLPERNVLLGGEPGGGKSVSVSLLVATAALHPSVRLTLLDGKLVELAAWRNCAEANVGVDVGEAIDVLRDVQAEMDDRYRRLLAEGKRKVSPGDNLPLHMVVCDELAHYLTAGTKPQSNEFAGVLRDLVSRGRAAGVIVVAATQKPSTDIVPSAVRDLFGFRWALRCNTPQASDTILGQGWAAQGYSAADIDSACRGVGYLLHEGGRPKRLRSYWLGDEHLTAIAARAEALRSERKRPRAAAKLIGG